jgi:uncharacterized RDD family membrane protein YckC
MTIYDYAEKPKNSVVGILAPLEKRLIALLIDGAILAIVGGLPSAASRHGMGFLIGFAISLAYNWYFLTHHNGQTPGKMLMGIRVVKTNGMALTGADVVVRYIGYYLNSLPFFFGAGWWWAIFDGQHQGFHDKLAQTYVVNVG